LMVIVRDVFGQDPLSGHLFIFCIRPVSPVADGVVGLV
jgi:hypothetical protein